MAKLVIGLTVMAVVALVGRAEAQCCGDCDGTGRVTINDLIVAVNNALSDCAPTATSAPSTPTPRPTATRVPTNRCPRGLEEGRGTCSFRGRYNNSCGNELDSILASDGNTAIVRIATMLQQPPFVYFAANVVDETHANLTAWSTDNFQNDVRSVSGALELPNNRERLVIFPDTSPFMIQGCAFTRYQGQFTGSSRARAAIDEDVVLGDAMDGLQAWRAAPPPELSQQP